MTIGTLVVVQAECCLEAHADKALPLCLGCRPCFEHKGLLRRWGSGLLHGMELGWAEQGWPNTAMLRSEMAGGKVLTALECVPERCLKLPTTATLVLLSQLPCQTVQDLGWMLRCGTGQAVLCTAPCTGSQIRSCQGCAVPPYAGAVHSE